MKVQTIIMVIVILLLLYVVMKYVLNDSNTLTGLISGTEVQTIVAKDLAKDDSGLQTSNYAYSIWYYIDDWNYNYDNVKPLFERLSIQPANTPVLETIASMPGVYFTANTNDLKVLVKTGTTSGTSETATVENVPIQKWTNVTISVYGQSLDIYLDGKLVQTKPLSNIAYIDPNASVYITPNGGFSGWTSKFAYYPNALNPQEVWDIYSAGYGSSWLSNLFGKYNVKISFLENGTEDSSFTF